MQAETKLVEIGPIHMKAGKGQRRRRIEHVDFCCCNLTEEMTGIIGDDNDKVIVTD